MLINENEYRPIAIHPTLLCQKQQMRAQLSGEQFRNMLKELGYKTRTAHNGAKSNLYLQIILVKKKKGK